MPALKQDPRIRRVLRLLPLTALVGVLALTLQLSPHAPAHARLVPTAASGALALVDSLSGGAILTATDMRPGSAVTGDVSILASSDLPLAVSLSDAVVSVGSLPDYLVLTVQDLTTGRYVYSGPLTGMGTVGVGTLAGRSAHDFRFTVRLRADAPNSLQNASATVRYDWGADIATGEGTGPGTANPPPGGGTGTGGGGTIAVPPRGDTHPPALRLVGKARQRLRPGALVAYAVCNEACTISPGAHVKGVRGVDFVPTRISTSHAAAGQHALIRVMLTKKALRRARSALHAAGGRKNVRVVLVVTATDLAGNRTGVTKTVVFRP